jgi:hypothetical protein
MAVAWRKIAAGLGDADDRLARLQFFQTAPDRARSCLRLTGRQTMRGSEVSAWGKSESFFVPLLESGKAKAHQVEIGLTGKETRGWKAALAGAGTGDRPAEQRRHFWHDFIPRMIYTQTNDKKLRTAQAYSLRSRGDDNYACALA